MHQIRQFICFIILTCWIGHAQQTNAVSGTVSDDQGLPLMGVSVIEVGTNNGTVTGFDGTYTIDVQNEAFLSFSYLGFVSQEYEILSSQTINVALQPDQSALEEVVVIGYGSVRRKDLTGSVGTADLEDINTAPVGSIDGALGGRVAGLLITSSQGRPGASTDIRIRGTGSLTQSSAPLFVIDGFPVEDFDITSIDQSDIESLQVLKGPSAVAIYGARGGNGVILISTKSGEVGKLRVSYNNFFGFQEITKRIDVLSPYEFVELKYEQNPDNAARYYGPLALYKKPDGSSIDGIDWQSLAFKQTNTQSHTFSINGGGEQTRYNLSASRYDGDGLLANSQFTRTYLKMKLNQNLTDKIKTGLNLSYTTALVSGVSTSSNTLNPNTGDGGGTSQNFNLLRNIVQARPTGGLFITNDEFIDLPVDPDLEEGEQGANSVNPLLNALTQAREDERRTLIINGFVEYEMIQGLKLNVRAGFKRLDRKRDAFDNVNSAFERRNGITRAVLTNSESDNTLISATLTYNKAFPKFNLTSMVGFDYQDLTSWSNSVVASGFPDSNLGVNNLGLSTIPSIPSSSKSPTNRISSIFSRLIVNVDEKYLFTGTLRRDGSSKFGNNNVYGLFPSFAFAWRFSEEKFSEKIKGLSDGKLRMEYGEVGNNRIPALVSRQSLGSTSYGFENGISPGVFPTNLSNPEIKWETQRQINLGLDLGLFKNKLTINFDLYRKESIDLLLRSPIPTSTGFTDVFRNIGEVRNEGIELAIQSDIITNKGRQFNWTSNFNISFNRSKTLALVEDDTLLSSSRWRGGNRPESTNDFITIVGQPITLIYGYLDDGLYTAEDFDEDGNPFIDLSFGDEQIGFRKYADLDNDGKVDENDKVILGNPNPDFFGGLTNKFSYKGFDLNVFLQWTYGNDIYNASKILWTTTQGNRNYHKDVVNRWRPNQSDEENARVAYPSIEDSNSRQVTDRFVEDGSYIRLKTVSMGYSLPPKLLNKVGISKFRIYVSGHNLWTLTDYSGFDPEVSTHGSGLTAGVDYGSYPRARTFVTGLSMTF
ncbi:MAG: TonB-dependent receptor [Flavobacteriaceae bacterium]|nr:TonB-dependent receptor [Flavobacteriaceae bacterium]